MNKRKFLPLLVLAALSSAALVTAVPAATTVFATGMFGPETITQTGSGDFFVTDAGPATNPPTAPFGPIWQVNATGGSAQFLADAGYSLRGGLLLPSTFGSVGGQFLVVGVGAASTMNTGTFAVTPYHSNNSVFWAQPVLAPNFGSLSSDVLVTNVGPGPLVGTVDYFTPSGEVGTLAPFPPVVTPFGAALADSSFGEAGGPSLFVSDATGGGIYTVDPAGNINLFTTIPRGTGQTGLRQIAFAPQGWGKYSSDLFVCLSTRDIDIVNRDGVIIGKITGPFDPRGMLFKTIAGEPTLLFSDNATGNILKAGPGDVVPAG
jgi:hypothetical protein